MSAIARRAALMKLSVISFSAAVLPLERLARAQSDLEPVSIKTPSGRKITAVLSLPTVLPAPAVMTIHGSLGSSGGYESLAAAVAKEGFVGLATDLYGGQL